MTRPQELHADLGLIDDDHTPDMRKTSVHPAKNATEATDQTPIKEPAMTSIAHPQTPTLADKIAEAAAFANERGFPFETKKTQHGPRYRVWSPDHDVLADTYALGEAMLAMENYWPAPESVGELDVTPDSGGTVVVQFSPPFADEAATVFVDLDGRTALHLSIDEAGALATVLMRAVCRAGREHPEAMRSEVVQVDSNALSLRIHSEGTAHDLEVRCESDVRPEWEDRLYFDTADIPKIVDAIAASALAIESVGQIIRSAAA